MVYKLNVRSDIVCAPAAARSMIITCINVHIMYIYIHDYTNIRYNYIQDGHIIIYCILLR